MSGTGSVLWPLEPSAVSDSGRAARSGGPAPPLGAGRHRCAVGGLTRCGCGELGKDLQAAVVLPVGGEVLPALDLGEGPLGPAVDGVEEADEEVDGQRPDVDLVLRYSPAVEELPFDGASRASWSGALNKMRWDGRRQKSAGRLDGPADRLLA